MPLQDQQRTAIISFTFMDLITFVKLMIIKVQNCFSFFQLFALSLMEPIERLL